MLRAEMWALMSIGVVLFLAGCAGDVETKPPAQTHTLSIKGELTYRERIALPPDSVAIVELRDVSSASGAVITERRIPLAGKQVPIAFELTVERVALAAGKAYAARGGVQQGARVSWASAAIAIDPTQAAIDLGMLNMTRVQAEAFSSTLRCGDQLVTVGMVGDAVQLTVGETRYALRQVEAASGAKYAAVDDPTTTFWSRGDRAMLAVKGTRYPECVRADVAAPAFRASGNEPGWQIEIGTRMVFASADGGTRVDALTPAARTAAGVQHYAVSSASNNLEVTVADRLCIDSMSGMPHPNTVTILLDGKTLQGCGGAPAVLLQGGEWGVVDIGGAGIVDRSHVTLNFGADGHLTGKGSCNSYMGSYTLTGEGLSVSKMASTMMACVPDALMQQESRFHEILNQVKRFRFGSDGALILQAGDGRTITARRGSQETPLNSLIP